MRKERVESIFGKDCIKVTWFRLCFSILLIDCHLNTENNAIQVNQLFLLQRLQRNPTVIRDNQHGEIPLDRMPLRNLSLLQAFRFSLGRCVSLVLQFPWNFPQTGC